MKRKKKVAPFVRFKRVVWVLVILFVMPIVLAYEGVDDVHEEESEEKSQTVSDILPFKYLEKEMYLTAFLIIVFWIAILKGIYELTLMVISKGIDKW